jgi:hypothetical protein
MVACGPRTNGSNPGKVLAYGKAAESAAVYKAFKWMPSGVFQPSASVLPFGADFCAAFSQSLNSTFLESGHGLGFAFDELIQLAPVGLVTTSFLINRILLDKSTSV